MIKQNKHTLIITSILILLPILVGVIFWDRLPETMATHFDMDGAPNGWSSRAFSVFGLPLFILACQWLCIVLTSADPKRRNIHPKVLRLILWVCPVASLLGTASIYAYALGYEGNVSRIAPVLMGVLFLLIGNYLPKCRQSYTLGIRIPWTLADEDNWNRTHRFAGPVWVVCGMLIVLCGLIGGALLWVMLAAFVVMIAAPTVYSYLLFKGKMKGKGQS